MTITEKLCWFLTISLLALTFSWATVPAYEPNEQLRVTRAGW